MTQYNWKIVHLALNNDCGIMVNADARFEIGRSWIRASVKPKTIQLVFAASLISTQHLRSKNND